MTAPGPPTSFDSIADGPRGRRLLLELAIASALEERTGTTGWDLASSVMRAAHVLDPSSGAILSFGSRSREASPELVTPADVAALLGRSRFASLTASMVRTALVASVDSARYWQEPDGTDALAATRELAPALSATLDRLMLTDHGDWWSNSAALSAQFAVVWTGREGPVPARARGTIAKWRRGIERMEANAAANWPRDAAASFSGTWWSTPGSDVLSSSHLVERWNGPSGLWLIEDPLGWTDARILTVATPPSARVLEVDSAADWARLCARHPISVTAQKRHDWYRTTGRVGPWIMPDWTATADEYDAIHLTVNGYLRAAGTAIPVGPGDASVIAGWAPDGTYWLTDATAEHDHSRMKLDSKGDWHIVSGPHHPVAPGAARE